MSYLEEVNKDLEEENQADNRRQVIAAIGQAINAAMTARGNARVGRGVDSSPFQAISQSSSSSLANATANRRKAKKEQEDRQAEEQASKAKALAEAVSKREEAQAKKEIEDQKNIREVAKDSASAAQKAEELDLKRQELDLKAKEIEAIKNNKAQDRLNAEQAKKDSLSEQRSYAEAQKAEDRTYKEGLKAAELDIKKKTVLTEIENRRQNIKNNLATAQKMIKENGTFEAFGSHNQILDGLMDAIATDMAKLQDPDSVARPSEVEMVKKSLVSPGFGNANSTAADILNKFESRINDTANTAYKVRGIAPPSVYPKTVTNGKQQATVSDEAEEKDAAAKGFR